MQKFSLLANDIRNPSFEELQIGENRVSGTAADSP